MLDNGRLHRVDLNPWFEHKHTLQYIQKDTFAKSVTMNLILPQKHEVKVVQNQG